MWFKVVSQGPLFVQVRLEFPVEAHQVMDGIVHGQADGHAGDQAGCHGQFDAQPSHDAEVDHDGKQVGHNGDQGHFPGEKQHEHDAENHHHGDGEALHLADGQLLAAGRYDNPEAGKRLVA
jgi:hypothetical protein